MDLIDSINPFGEAYNILAKTMNEDRLRQVQTAIAGRRVQLSPDEARDLARRAFGGTAAVSFPLIIALIAFRRTF